MPTEIASVALCLIVIATRLHSAASCRTSDGCFFPLFDLMMLWSCRKMFIGQMEVDKKCLHEERLKKMTVDVSFSVYIVCCTLS